MGVPARPTAGFSSFFLSAIFCYVSHSGNRLKQPRPCPPPPPHTTPHHPNFTSNLTPTPTPTNQPTCQPTNQPPSQPTNQPTNQLTNQSTNHLINQSIHPPMTNLLRRTIVSRTHGIRKTVSISLVFLTVLGSDDNSCMSKESEPAKNTKTCTFSVFY